MVRLEKECLPLEEFLKKFGLPVGFAAVGDLAPGKQKDVGEPWKLIIRKPDGSQNPPSFRVLVLAHCMNHGGPGSFIAFRG